MVVGCPRSMKDYLLAGRYGGAKIVRIRFKQTSVCGAGASVPVPKLKLHVVMQ
jgi:hypothetical protein